MYSCTTGGPSPAVLLYRTTTAVHPLAPASVGRAGGGHPIATHTHTDAYTYNACDTYGAGHTPGGERDRHRAGVRHPIARAPTTRGGAAGRGARNGQTRLFRKARKRATLRKRGKEAKTRESGERRERRENTRHRECVRKARKYDRKARKSGRERRQNARRSDARRRGRRKRGFARVRAFRALFFARFRAGDLEGDGDARRAAAVLILEHLCTHTHTRTHTHIRIHAKTPTDTPTQTHSLTRTHARTHARKTRLALPDTKWSNTHGHAGTGQI